MSFLEDPIGTWVFTTRAAADFRVSATTLRKWRRRCPVLGRPITAKQEGRSWYYLLSDLNQACPNEACTYEAWLPVVDAASEYGIPKETIRAAIRRGTVRTIPGVRNVGFKSGRLGLRNVKLCSRDDVQAWRDRRCATVSGEWIASPNVVAEFGWSISTLGYWRRNCPLLNRRISAKQLVYKGKLVWHYLRADLVERQDVIRQEEKSEWLRRSETSVHPVTLSRYKLRGCPALDGRIPRYRVERRLVPLKNGRVRHQNVEVWHPDDMAAIERRLQDAAIGTDGAWLTYHAAEQAYGVSRKTLNVWVHKKRCPKLGRALKTKKEWRIDRAGGRKLIRFVHRDDLNEIVGGDPVEDKGNGQSVSGSAGKLEQLTTASKLFVGALPTDKNGELNDDIIGNVETEEREFFISDDVKNAEYRAIFGELRSAPPSDSMRATCTRYYERKGHAKREAKQRADAARVRLYQLRKAGLMNF